MKAGSRLGPLLGGLALLGLWTLLAARTPPVLLPSPLEVLEAAWREREALLEASASTAGAALGGLGLASALGMIGGVTFLRSRWLEGAFYPWALLVQTTPIVAIAPLLVVWLGYGLPVAIASAAIASFFPVLTAADVGLRATEPEQLELLRLYRAGFLQTLWKLRLPAALPYLFSGLRTAGGLSVIGAIVGEFVGSNGLPPSLGYLVLRAARTAETGLSIAAVLAASALSLAIYGAVRSLERWVIGRWHAGGSS